LIALFDRIPYAIEQGKFSAEQGIDLAEQGILLRHQRNAAWLAGGGRTEATSIVMDSDGLLQPQGTYDSRGLAGIADVCSGNSDAPLLTLNHSRNFDHRRRPETLLTAMATALR